MTDLKHSPLHGRHIALGAKMADFGGWEMPIEYPGQGVLKEHAAVREGVGVFDVSHLGKGSVRGPGALDFVNARLTNDLRRVGSGQAQYTLCCSPEGGVVDDLIVYVHSDDDIFLIPNAANTATVMALLAAEASSDLVVEDLHTSRGVLAVQGPRSADLLTSLGLPTDLDYMSFTTVDDLVLCRTGYTGELGFELLPTWATAAALWDALLAAGESLGVLACGLGARDTLRTEMGYPLHGQDLSLSISPVQAKSGWAVGWDKPEFWGREALVAEKAAGAARSLWGLESQDRGIPRGHMVVRKDGREIGEVTSGTFSPTRRLGIGLALLERGAAEGDEVTVDVRGRASVMKVVRPPFVPSHVR